MKYIKINENGIHIVFGITDKNQIKLLHFSKAEFDENDICKFGKECKAEDLVRKFQVDISHILGNLITVIFNYQILRKPLKILSL